MSYVQNIIMRKIQILVSQKVFDYASDFVVAVNVLVVSVSIRDSFTLQYSSVIVPD